MKVSVDKNKGFEPVSITFTIETQDEGNAFFCLFNYVPITNFLKNHMGNKFDEQVRDVLEERGLAEGYAALWDEVLKIKWM